MWGWVRGSAHAASTVWSVLSGLADLHLVDAPASPVLDMAWHPREHHLLLTLRHPNVLALWDTAKGQIVWRKIIPKTEDLGHVLFNPHPAGLPLHDIFFASTKGAVYHMPNVLEPTDLALRYRIASSDAKSVFRSMHFTDAHRGCVFFVLSREVLVMHSQTQYSVGGFTLERNMGDLAAIRTAAQHPDCVWALHDDGRVSVWRSDSPDSLHFVHVASSAPLRFAKVRRLDAPPLLSFGVCAERGGTVRSVAVDRAGQFFAWRFEAPSAPHLRLMELVPSLMAPVTSFALHPTDTLRQVACGTAAGTLLLVDLRTRCVVREFMVDVGQPITCVQWMDADTVVCATVQELQADAVWSNVVHRLDVRAGHVQPLMHCKKAEPTHILALLFSPSRRHMLIWRKDRPLELWEVQGGLVAHLGNVKPYIQMTALAWRTGAGVGEEFCAATVDNMLRFFRVDEGKLSISRQQESIVPSTVGALAWRADLVAAGDVAGGLSCYDWSRKVCWTIPTRSTAIVDVQWNSVDAASSLLAVVYASGLLARFDMGTKKCQVESKLLTERAVRTTAVQWADESGVLVAATADGCMRVLQAESWAVTCAPALQANDAPPTTPYLLEPRLALTLKVALLRGEPMLTASGAPESEVAVYEALLTLLVRWLFAGAESLSYAQRALRVAQWYGDRREEDLWRVLSRPAVESLIQFEPDAPVVAAAVPAATPASDAPWSFCRMASPPAPSVQDELPQRFGLLRPSGSVHLRHVWDTATMEQRRNPADQASLHVCAQRFLLHGDKQNAIRMLLSSDAASSTFVMDSLLACVVAAASGPEYFERTVKMVSSNLVVGGHVDVGVQLLALVNRSDDACRHLQDAGRWEDAALLAKLQLSPDAQRDVLLRWARQLVKVGDERALPLLVSLGQHAEALAHLHSRQEFLLAQGLLRHVGGPPPTALDAHVADSIHLDYGFFLHRLGLDLEASEQFAQSGAAGQQMLETLSAPLPAGASSARPRSQSAATSAVVSAQPDTGLRFEPRKLLAALQASRNSK